MWRAIWAGAVLVSFAACGGCDSVPSQAVTACEGISVAAEKTDILFVVDDSGSMKSSQDNLRDSFGKFIARLDASPVKNAYQIGITTTSVDYAVAAGTFATTFPPSTYECPAPGNPWSLPPDPPASAGDPFPAGALVRVDGNTDQCSRRQFETGTPRILAAGSPTLVADFTANVFVGVVGSGKEQGLRTARLALSEPLLSGANAGFLRPGARLAVIIVSDDDDCSDPERTGTSNEPTACTTHLVQDYVTFFQGPIGGEDRRLVVGGIIAVAPDPTTGALVPTLCQKHNPDGSLMWTDPPANTTPATTEHAAPRYFQFLQSFGQNGIVDSICNATFDDTLVAIASMIGQEVPLSSTPADWRLLTVSVVKPGGNRVPCTVSESGSDGGAGDVVYAPPTATRPPTLTFGGACALQAGDQVDVKLVCAG
jgi:hypothetical protein